MTERQCRLRAGYDCTTWTQFVAGENDAQLVEMLGYDPAGCDHCSYGIVAEPDTRHVPVPLYLRRAIAASQGQVLFCDCQAGQAQRSLMERYLKRIPAYFLDAQDKSRMVEKRSGGYRWVSGTCPLYYIPDTTLRAVLDAIAEAPPVHLEKL